MDTYCMSKHSTLFLENLSKEKIPTSTFHASWNANNSSSPAACRVKASLGRHLLLMHEWEAVIPTIVKMDLDSGFLKKISQPLAPTHQHPVNVLSQITCCSVPLQVSDLSFWAEGLGASESPTFIPADCLPPRPLQRSQQWSLFSFAFWGLICNLAWVHRLTQILWKPPTCFKQLSCCWDYLIFDSLHIAKLVSRHYPG